MVEEKGSNGPEEGGRSGDGAQQPGQERLAARIDPMSLTSY